MAVQYYDDNVGGITTNYVITLCGTDFYEIKNKTSAVIFVKFHGTTQGYKIRLMPNQSTNRHVTEIVEAEIFNISSVKVEHIYTERP